MPRHHLPTQGLFGEHSVLVQLAAAAALPPRRVGLLVPDALSSTGTVRMFTMPVTLPGAANTTTPAPAPTTAATPAPAAPGSPDAASAGPLPSSAAAPPAPAQPLVYAGADVLEDGCTGFILYGKASGTGAAPPLPPRSALLLCRALLGWPRFASLSLGEQLLPHLQPPHTAPPPPPPPEAHHDLLHPLQKLQRAQQGWARAAAWPPAAPPPPVPVDAAAGQQLLPPSAWPPVNACLEPPLRVSGLPELALPPHLQPAWPAALAPALAPAGQEGEGAAAGGEGVRLRLPHASAAALQPRLPPSASHKIRQLPLFLLGPRFHLCTGAHGS